MSASPNACLKLMIAALLAAAPAMPAIAAGPALSAQPPAAPAATSDTRTGVLVEYDKTSKIFENPADRRTEDYITGRVG